MPSNPSPLDPNATQPMDPNKTLFDPKQAGGSETVVNKELAGRTAIDNEMAGRTMVDPNKTVVNQSNADQTVARPDPKVKADVEAARAAERQAKAPKPSGPRPEPPKVSGKESIEVKRTPARLQEQGYPKKTPPVKLGAENDPTRRLDGGRGKDFGEAPTRRLGKNPPPARGEMPTRRMTKAQIKQAVKTGKAPAPAPAGSKPVGGTTMRCERVFTNEEIEALNKTGRLPRKFKLPKIGWRGLAAGAAGALLLVGAFYGIDWAFNRAKEKMGPDADLTAYLPQNNEVIWVSAPYSRQTRDEADPFWEPNVFTEKVAIDSPSDGVAALGISLSGLPEQFTNDINVNGLGDGNSDWLCEPFGGYLICRSLGSYPLLKNSTTIVTMQFHLPADEMKKYLSAGAGTRSAYLVETK